MKKIVVFASGSGTNFQSIIDSVGKGEIQAEIEGLIVSRRSAGASNRAEKAGIPVQVIRPADFNTEEAFGKEILRHLNRWEPDLIVLAGYMVKIPGNVIEAYPSRIINIHPALLPRYGGKGFFGKRVHQAVLDAGDKETGCTVHYVNEKYDQGPIIAQRNVPVKSDDTPESLARRVLSEEHKLLPQVIQQLLSKQNH